MSSFSKILGKLCSESELALALHWLALIVMFSEKFLKQPAPKLGSGQHSGNETVPPTKPPPSNHTDSTTGFEYHGEDANHPTPGPSTSPKEPNFFVLYLQQMHDRNDEFYTEVFTADLNCMRNWVKVRDSKKAPKTQRHAARQVVDAAIIRVTKNGEDFSREMNRGKPKFTLGLPNSFYMPNLIHRENITEHNSKNRADDC
jgi:hypothetical protein